MKPGLHRELAVVGPSRAEGANNALYIICLRYFFTKRSQFEVVWQAEVTDRNLLDHESVIRSKVQSVCIHEKSENCVSRFSASMLHKEGVESL